MREKLRSRRGLTMVELLAAAAVLILLGLMLHTGLLMAQHIALSIAKEGNR